MTASMANFQGGPVLNANVPNGSGVSEVEYTITFGAVGAPTLVTNRGDLIASVTRTGGGFHAPRPHSPGHPPTPDPTTVDSRTHMSDTSDKDRITQLEARLKNLLAS